MPKRAIFVPGLPASHLIDQADGSRFFFKLFESDDPRLEGPADLRAASTIRAGEPIGKALSFLFFDLAKQADRLYEILHRIGCSPVNLGWDWRRPVWDDIFDYSVQNRLAGAIETHGSEQQGVVVIVHSTGGLVLRALLEAKPELTRKIEKVIAFGVPWAGTPRSLQVMTGQERFAPASARRSQQIIVRSWAGWDLVPPDPQNLLDADSTPLMLTYRTLGPGLREQASALLDTDWLNSLPAEMQADARLRLDAANAHLGSRQPTLALGGNRLEIINIVGFGQSTPFEAELRGHGGRAQLIVKDAKRDASLDDGDGTAPFRSVMWLASSGGVNATTYQLPVGLVAGGRPKINPHSRLWSNPGGSDLLHHHLGDEPFGDFFCHAALDGDDIKQQPVADPIRLRAVALDQQGQPLAGVVIQTRPRDQGWTDRPIRTARGGRYLVEVPLHHCTRVANSNARRLESRIGWLKNGHRKWQPQSFGFVD